MTKNNKVGDGYVNFYENNRLHVSELYPSEKKIFSYIDCSNKTILDVGCAAGGFYSIMKELYGPIDYSGIDISEEMIKISKTKYPEISENFYTGSASNLSFKDNTFDIVLCNSVQAHNYEYREIFFEKMLALKGVRLPGDRRHKNRLDLGPRKINKELIDKITELSD